MGCAPRTGAGASLLAVRMRPSFCALTQGSSPCCQLAGARPRWGQGGSFRRRRGGSAAVARSGARGPSARGRRPHPARSTRLVRRWQVQSSLTAWLALVAPPRQVLSLEQTCQMSLMPSCRIGTQAECAVPGRWRSQTRDWATARAFLLRSGSRTPHLSPRMAISGLLEQAKMGS